MGCVSLNSNYTNFSKYVYSTRFWIKMSLNNMLFYYCDQEFFDLSKIFKYF